MHLYCIAGLTVASEIALPGARAATGAQEPDVVMRRGDVPAHLDNPSVKMPNWEADADRFLLRSPGVARFLLRGGRDIVFQPEPGGDDADCAIYLLGTVFGALLHQRGHIVLHASAVAVDGAAVLFCGRSGLGKSTLAAALSMRGFPLLSDDVCAIGFDGGGNPYVQTDSRQLKLADDAIASFGLDRRRGPAVLKNMAKYYVEPAVGTDAAELPIGRIYILRRREVSQSGIDTPVSAEVLRLLQRNAYRPGIVKRTGQAPRYFAAAAKIVRKAGVYGLTAPRDLARVPETLDLLQRHWTKNGLSRPALIR
jgi:hypothetical protein